MDEDCTQPLSSDPKIKPEYHSSSLYLTISGCVESPQVGVFHALHKRLQLETGVREGLEYAHKSTTHQQHAQMQRIERNNKVTG
jgi:hypothetical protein